MSVETVLEAVRTLSREEQLELVKRVIDWLAAPASIGQPRSIFEFEGIASHLADEEDPQQFIRRLRDEWNK